MSSYKPILEALKIMISPGDVVEIRAPSVDNGRGFVQSQFGYFDDLELAAKAAAKLDTPNCDAVYFTVNPTLPDLLARAANRIVASKKNSKTTADVEIVKRNWFYIDIDPIRPGGTSSSDEEHQLSLDIATAISQQLEVEGWPEPLICDSGNGGHLQYRIDLPNDDVSRDLIHDCLKALRHQFNIEGKIDVDNSVFNASRICKLYGTTARKGDSIPSRPHRLSKILVIPNEITVVPHDKLVAMAKLAPKPVEKQSKTTPSSASLTKRVRAYLDKIDRPISGCGANEAIYKAACVAVNDYAMSDQEAISVVMDWAGGTWEYSLFAKLVKKAQKYAKGQQGSLKDVPLKRDEPKPKKPKEKKPEKPIAPVTPGEKSREFYNQLRITDMGNAERLVKTAGKNVKYTQEWGWLVWDGKRWTMDDVRVREAYKKCVVPQIYQEVSNAALSKDSEAAKLLLKWATKSESAAQLSNAMSIAKSDPRIYSSFSDFDAGRWLINAQNGTIDLRTGELRKHRQEDLITKIMSVDYDPEAKCPEWDKFMARIFRQTPGLIKYMQKALGYTLVGTTEEQVMFILYGLGQNGKSVMMTAISNIMADYAMETPADTLMAKSHGGGIPNDVARLAGARLVTANETESGQRLAESKVKGMSGGDMLTARYLNKEFFQFMPEFNLFIRTNHLPQIRGSDDGIWRRIRPIHFKEQISMEERDPKLHKKLESEYAGILAWIVRGCLLWQREGLGAPPSVIESMQAYREDMDIIARFLSDRCVLLPANTGSTSAATLFQEYKEWCEEAGERPLSKRRLGQSLVERGIGKRRMNTGFTYDGIILNDGSISTSVKCRTVYENPVNLPHEGKILSQTPKNPTPSYTLAPNDSPDSSENETLI